MWRAGGGSGIQDVGPAILALHEKIREGVPELARRVGAALQLGIYEVGAGTGPGRIVPVAYAASVDAERADAADFLAHWASVVEYAVVVDRDAYFPRELLPDAFERKICVIVAYWIAANFGTAVVAYVSFDGGDAATRHDHTKRRIRTLSEWIVGLSGAAPGAGPGAG